MSTAGDAEPLRLNIWLGPRTESECALGPGANEWLNNHELPHIGTELLAELPDYCDWCDPRVGWSLLLPHDDGLSLTELAQPFVKPERDKPPRRLDELWELWEERGSPPVYRYDPRHKDYLIRRSTEEPYEQALQPEISTSKIGIGVNQIPFYLLIHGGPDRVPWEVQFWLNPFRAVGRLDLEGEPLANYVRHLRKGWARHRGTGYRTLVWSTAHDEMTRLMHRAVAQELHAKYHGDSLPAVARGAKLLEVDEALCDRLIVALGQHAPGLIVTTSHGCMDLRGSAVDSRLGVPVDQSLQPLDPAKLLQAWQPRGVIWFALACCSAGSLHRNSFAGLIDPKSDVHAVLEDAAQRFGSRVAPLPRLLLGASEPARAFVGHVEPTFDRGAKNPETGEFFNGGLLDAFYQHLFLKDAPPIGYALQTFYRPFVNLRATRARYQRRWNGNKADGREGVLGTLLRASDVSNTVLLGDPTVRLDYPHKRSRKR